MTKHAETNRREMVIRGFAEHLAELHLATAEARREAIPALEMIANAIEAYPTSGQIQRLTGFLAAVYNGFVYQFSPKDLRVLDRDLCTACLAVLAYDHFGMEEIHTMGVFSADDLHRWIEREGIEPICDRR